MRKIKTRRLGIVHYHSGCYDCGVFSAGFLTKETPTKKDVRDAAKAHARSEGHTVWIESGSSTVYEPMQGGNNEQI